MKGKLILALLLALLVASCADTSHQQKPDKPKNGGKTVVVQPSGVWPDMPCPPGASMTARLKLDQIMDWAVKDQRQDVEEAAEKCRDDHATDPQHQGEALVPLGKVHTAWQRAKQAKAESNPQRKQQIWDFCKSELDHTP